VSRFFEGRIPPELVREPAAEATKSFEVSVLPETYLIGVDGGLLLRFGGARDCFRLVASLCREGVEPSGLC
jgi:hypothetical protein